MKTLVKLGVLIAMVAVSACEDDVIQPGEKGWKMHAWKIPYYNAVIRSYDSEIVLEWNEALGLAIENKMPTSAEAKIFAMVSLAIHDALNNIIPKYELYATGNIAENAEGLTKWNVSEIADAAVAQAAHDALVALFPPSKVNADNLLVECLSKIEDGELKARGIAIGIDAAAAVLTKRQGDPPMTFSAYSQGTDPGTHQANYMPFAVANPPLWPANAVYGANLGSFTPFGIASAGQFRPGPPNALTSAAYTKDYNEVKVLGCAVCPDRTEEQTEIGNFWKGNTSGPMNTIARLLAVQRHLNGWETARLLALTQMAQADANIASFEAKYYYNYWLPITAIRAGDTDGNDDTHGDAAWAPAVAPPPTPDYPSTPATAGGASAEIFRQFFGTDRRSFTIENLPGIKRKYTSFSEFSVENSLARIYLGSHFRNSVTEGEKQGRKIGKYIIQNNLKEVVAFL